MWTAQGYRDTRRATQGLFCQRSEEAPTLTQPCAHYPLSSLPCQSQVVFAGFSADSLAGRMMDSKPRVVLTCSAVRRGNKVIGLKEIVDKAADICSKQGFDVGKTLTS